MAMRILVWLVGTGQSSWAVRAGPMMSTIDMLQLYLCVLLYCMAT